jgi:general secretion pathway protein A
MESNRAIYAIFYGLRGRPFHVTADWRNLFLGDDHKEAFAAIVHGVRAGKGFVVITGEVGVGKTTVLGAALAELAGDRQKLVRFVDPTISIQELYRQIAETLSGEVTSAADVDRVLELLVEQYREGTRVVVVIDEAQRTSTDVLESLRMLSNFETDVDKLVQTVLVGQPELEALLERHDMRQLRSRIAYWVRISPLEGGDSRAYIRHCLAQAGGGKRRVFSRGATNMIVRAARGIPRLLNIYCDNALLAGFGRQTKTVGRALARSALSGFPDARLGWWRRPFFLGASVVGAIAFVIAAAFMLLVDHRAASRELVRPMGLVAIVPAIATPAAAANAGPVE